MREGGTSRVARAGVVTLTIAVSIFLWDASCSCFGALETYRMEVGLWWLPGAPALHHQALRFGAFVVPLFGLSIAGAAAFTGLLNSRNKRLLLARTLATGLVLGAVLVFLARVPFGVQHVGPASVGYAREEVWDMVSSPALGLFYPPLWLLWQGLGLWSIFVYAAAVAAAAVASVAGTIQALRVGRLRAKERARSSGGAR